MKKTTRQPFYLLSTLLISAVLLPTVANAQTTWTGAGVNDNWFTSTNWDTGVVPNGSTFDVIVNAPAPTLVNGTPSINSLQLGSSGILNINSGSLGFSGTAANTLTSQGQINLTGGGGLQLKNTINNSGSIINGNATLSTLAGGATLTGGGTVTMQVAAVIGGVPGSILTIEDQTIDGSSGNGIGNGQIGVDNDGLIDANVSGLPLSINPSSEGVVNTGTMQASDGGILNLNGNGGGTFDNTGGTIQALEGSEVVYSSGLIPHIVGGLITSTGTGTHSVSSGVSLTDVTNTGNIDIAGGASLRMSGTFTNAGTISNNGTVFIESDIVTLTGGGTITFSASSVISGNPGTTLAIENQTIEGTGNLFGGLGSNLIDITTTVESLIHANVSGLQLVIDPVGAPEIPWVNEGTLLASNGANLKSLHHVVNNGTIEVDGGNFVCDRQIVCTEGSLLTGDGTVFSNLLNQSIVLDGIVAPGSSPGTMVLSGGGGGTGVNSLFVTMGSTAELQIELASASSFDVLQILGDFIHLDGTLSVTLLDGFVPDPSDTFLIVNSLVDNFSGSFNNDSSIVCVSGGGIFDVTYSEEGSVTLSNFQPGSLVLGDVNLDCNVNLLDVSPFVDRIITGTFQPEADINGDGVVNLLDVSPFVALLTGG